jgi:hypothetical protein
MAQAIHLGIDELEARFRVARDVVERTHCQVVWLLARGYAVADVAELVAMTPRWVNALARRYERDGIEALGDRPRHNHGVSPLLSEADLEALRQRLATPPDDGVLWTSRTAANSPSTVTSHPSTISMPSSPSDAAPSIKNRT